MRKIPIDVRKAPIMSRWNLLTPKKSIEWRPAPGECHMDDLEMAGFAVSHVVKYGVSEEKGFILLHHPVFPTLRRRPNNTHASYQLDVPPDCIPTLLVNGQPVRETLRRVVIDGTLRLETDAPGLSLTHHCFPSERDRAAYELVTVTNTGAAPLSLAFSTPSSLFVNEEMGCMGICVTEVYHTGAPVLLAPSETYTYDVAITGRLANEKAAFSDAKTELSRRYRTIERLVSPMALDTGCDVLDTMFAFAKLRAGESVFDTKYGLIHSPGGYSYYAATWCNDQVEYAGPYFAYTGDPILLEASLNAYRMYMPFMSDSYRPIPSSVIAEGMDYWNGAGDRGDAAMYLYGASHFCLTTGDPVLAAELLPAIRWCAAYCERKKTVEGVIASDSDELEGRFPAGKANLCTNTLCRRGLLGAAALERAVGDPSLAAVYEARAEDLRHAIDRYFAKEIHGMDTYAYYEGCDLLRSWICMPLCFGIHDRAKGTVEALTSPYLMKPDGLLTAEGCPTIWDRSTLYGLRGIFASGSTEKAMELLLQYCENRLLGDRVPYAVEAYPEGGRRHLSGESALFCKVITEGMLAMTPASLSSFTLKPSLPDELDHLSLKNVRAYGAVFDLLLDRDGFRVFRSNGDLAASGQYGELATVQF